MKNLCFLTLLLLAVAVTAQDTPRRPQEPSQPYPYSSEDVTFQNQEANITLAGTLTLPLKSNDYPVVVLISGSSPHNRDQEVAGHKTFLVLADYLTRNGIGVFRYDDRGMGQSEGTYEIGAYADRASDVLSALAYLKTRKEINQNKMGLIGHSEGGLIAPKVASESNDVSFIVTMGAPALPASEIMLMQRENSNKAQGVSDTDTQAELAFLKNIFDAVTESVDLDKTRSELSTALKSNPDGLPEGMNADAVDGILETFASSWFQKILRYDPRTALVNVNCPVLAINGDKDLQMPAKENLAAIKSALEKGGNQNVTIMELQGLNHMLQEAETGLPEEFETIPQTISPVALNAITEWIENQ